MKTGHTLAKLIGLFEAVLEEGSPLFGAKQPHRSFKVSKVKWIGEI